MGLGSSTGQNSYKQWHLKELGDTQMVIRPSKVRYVPDSRYKCRQENGEKMKKSTTRRSVPNMEIKEAALNSETIWIRSVGFQHPSDGKVCAYD